MVSSRQKILFGKKKLSIIFDEPVRIRDAIREEDAEFFLDEFQ